jgi:hypothetical protein
MCNYKSRKNDIYIARILTDLCVIVNTRHVFLNVYELFMILYVYFYVYVIYTE